ncbi:MAG: phage virion morphogenesis protein [Deltaproteobacteria bacterium]
MIKIKVDTTGISSLIKRFNSKSQDYTPATRQIAGRLEDAVEENFKQQGRPKWQPLAPSTLRQRQREGKADGKILQRTGQLAASISSEHDKTSATVGTNNEYAAAHQFGAEIKRAARSELFVRNRSKRGDTKGRFKKGVSERRGFNFGDSATRIPARPFLSLTDDDTTGIEAILKRFLDDR